jgi:hypothetical protein
MQHMEGRDEIAGLHFWNGEPTVLLIEADEVLGAMLLEECRPGTALRSLLKRNRTLCWLACFSGSGRSRRSDIDWAAGSLAGVGRWPDAGLV